MAELRYFAVATRADIEPGEVFIAEIAEIDGLMMAICNVDGEFYAIEDCCTHDGSSFDQTDLEGPEIFCPRHGALFNVITGDVLGPPANEPVPTFPVRLNGETIEVGVER